MSEPRFQVRDVVRHIGFHRFPESPDMVVVRTVDVPISKGWQYVCRLPSMETTILYEWELMPADGSKPDSCPSPVTVCDTGVPGLGQPFHLSYTAEEMSRMSASRVVLKVGDRVRERLAPWFSYTIHSFVDVGGQVMAHGFGKRAGEPWQFFHKPSDLELQEKESD